MISVRARKVVTFVVVSVVVAWVLSAAAGTPYALVFGGAEAAALVAVVLLLAGDRARRLRRDKVTKTRGFLAGIRLPQSRVAGGGSSSAGKRLISGNLTLDETGITWSPWRRFKRQGILPWSATWSRFAGYTAKQGSSLVPAAEISLRLSDGTMVELSVTDPRDINSLLAQNIGSQQ